MLGLGAYASSSSGDETENVKVDKSPPVAVAKALFWNDPRVPEEPPGDVDEATAEHWRKTLSSSVSVIDSILNDKSVQDPGFIASAIKQYGIDPDATNLPASVWNPNKVKADLPQFLSALKEEQMVGRSKETVKEEGRDSTQPRPPGKEAETGPTEGEDAGGGQAVTSERKRKRKKSRWDK